MYWDEQRKRHVLAPSDRVQRPRAGERREGSNSREAHGFASVCTGRRLTRGLLPTDSYFPPPPSSVLRDNEASGRGRHPDTIGAR